MKWHKRGITQLSKTPDGNWGNPQGLYVRGLQRMNKGDFANYSFSNDGNWLFISMSKRIGSKNNNLYVCKRYDDIFWRPRKLRKPIRGYTKEEAPFLSIDQNYLYFSSSRKHPNKKGKHDIYRATRKDETFRRWINPEPLSDTINTPYWESYYITNAKGSWAYFCSTNNSFGKSDIFRVKLYEENPYVLVSGKIVNKKDNLPLPQNVVPRLVINGKVIDTVNVNFQGEYKILLPLKNKYELSAVATNYDPFNKVLVDVTNEIEYTTKDSVILFLTPSNALVYGKIIPKNFKGSIPSEAEPVILINGKVLDDNLKKEMGLGECKIDFDNGNFSLRLPLKTSYTISIRAKGYYSKPIKVDLSRTEEYKEIEKDIYVSPFIASVSGKLLIENTLSLIPKNADPVLLVNGIELSENTINQIGIQDYKVNFERGEYSLSLPLKNSYDIQIKAKGYVSYPVKIDLSEIEEYKEIQRDLFVSEPPKLYVLITGKVYDKKNNKPFDPNKEFSIKVNDGEASLVKINKEEATYEVKLDLGKKYTINAFAQGYYPQYEMVDVTNEKQTIKVVKDLYLSPIEVGQSIKLNNIYFDFGKATLRPESYPELEHRKEYPLLGVIVPYVIP